MKNKETTQSLLEKYIKEEIGFDSDVDTDSLEIRSYKIVKSDIEIIYFIQDNDGNFIDTDNDKISIKHIEYLTWMYNKIQSTILYHSWN